VAAPRPAILFTGFPGFIGARLLPRILELQPGARVVCLVQERFEALAREQLAAILGAHAHARGRIELVRGDITLAGLGLDQAVARALREELTGCHHLAAVYDLAVSRELGQRINVLGTRNVLDFLREARRFERLDYVSTAYVSGKAAGVFRETDLDVGQSFKNHYEETKYLAELEVVKSGLPRAIYRPGIVVGDSRTGETAKFDGPYSLLTAFERLPSPGLFLRIGKGRSPVNLVPVDFVIEALARLSAGAASLGQTYHLTDPQPLPALAIARLFAQGLGKRFAFVPLPLALAKALLAPRPVQRALGVRVQTLDYFDHPCTYDCAAATRDLAPLGIACPRLPDYAERLIAFYRARRDQVRRDAMI
jgi:thioester reductase-like protein